MQNKPKMILFDYGNTLLYEPDWDSTCGDMALMKYITKNPNNCTLEDIRNSAEVIFGTHIERVRELGYDISAHVGNRVLYECLGIEFSLTPVEHETVFWDAASYGAVMPGADEMIKYINSKGIRSAIISNLLWSGEALTIRFRRLLPDNRFEFVITSSDYLFRKPNPILFKTALGKAGLNAEDVWFCGDNTEADVEGSAAVGIYPVWYENKAPGDYKKTQKHTKAPHCEHLHICDWNELILALEQF